MKMSLGGFCLRVLIGVILLKGEVAFAADGDENLSQDTVLSFVDFVSDSDAQVRDEVELYFDSSKKYFRKYKKRLRKKWIKKASAVSVEVVLNDALAVVKKSVHAEGGTKATKVLERLNVVSGGEFEKNDCYSELMSAYRDIDGYGAIVNVLRNSRIAPMPYECIDTSGYKLADIIENTDSYNFLLLEKDQAEQIQQMAREANIKFRLIEPR